MSFSHIANDARVLKQVRRLVERWDVVTCGYGPSPHEQVTHLQIPDEAGYRVWRRSDLILRRFRTIYWEQPAVRSAQDLLRDAGDFDVVIANDIDTLGVALQVGPTGRVHGDIHEYAPLQNEEILVWRVFIAPYVRWMCHQFLAKAGSLTTVGAGISALYRRHYGVDAGVVTNATPYADLRPRPVGATIRLVHSGASIRNRRLENLIDAVLSTTTEVSLDFYLMGNDPAYVDELKRRAGDSERVRFCDPLPYAQLIGRLNDYDIGVHVIPPTNTNNALALPNKFFDYVQARLAVLIGPSAEMRDILTQHKFGLVAAGFDSRSIARALDGLDAETVLEWKAAADKAAPALSAEVQIDIWEAALRELVTDLPS